MMTTSIETKIQAGVKAPQGILTSVEEPSTGALKRALLSYINVRRNLSVTRRTGALRFVSTDIKSPLDQNKLFTDHS